MKKKMELTMKHWSDDDDEEFSGLILFHSNCSSEEVEKNKSKERLMVENLYNIDGLNKARRMFTLYLVDKKIV